MKDLILSAAVRTGSAVVKDILTAHLGPTIGGIAGTVIDSVAGKLGVEPGELPSVPQGELDAAVAAVNQDPEILRLYVESHSLSVKLQLAEMSGEAIWTWAWRPAWMWFLMLLWFAALIVFPLLNSTGSITLPLPDLSNLIYLTGAYLALYMGGHTAKSILGGQNK